MQDLQLHEKWKQAKEKGLCPECGQGTLGFGKKLGNNILVCSLNPEHSRNAKEDEERLIALREKGMANCP